MESETVKELGIEVFSDEQKVSSIRSRQGSASLLAVVVPALKAWRKLPYLSTPTHSAPRIAQVILADSTTWKVLQDFPWKKDGATCRSENAEMVSFLP